LKKKEARNNNPSNNNGYGNRQNYDSQDVVFTATSKNGTLSNNIWICDSGACGHYCKSIEGMFNLKDIAETITVGNGNSMTAAKVGSLRHCIVQLNGSTLDVTINEVKYVPHLCANLLSINKAIKNGFNLSNNGTSICLTKGSASITFDRIMNTLSGSISGITMVSHQSSVAYVGKGKSELIKSIDINKFHEMIRNYGFDCLKRTATKNMALFEECQSKGYGIKFEFSGPQTPQQNGKVEREFQTFFRRIRAILNSAGLKNQLRSGVWAA
jgi:hypothetical protein